MPSPKASVIVSAMAEKASSKMPVKIIEWFMIRFSSFSSRACLPPRSATLIDSLIVRKWVPATPDLGEEPPESGIVAEADEESVGQEVENPHRLRSADLGVHPNRVFQRQGFHAERRLVSQVH
jgi:hypothetical protein